MICAQVSDVLGYLKYAMHVNAINHTVSVKMLHNQVGPYFMPTPTCARPDSAGKKRCDMTLPYLAHAKTVLSVEDTPPGMVLQGWPCTTCREEDMSACGLR